MVPKMKWHTIKPKMAWPIIDKWSVGFGISDRELSSLSDATQPGFTETITFQLVSAWPQGITKMSRMCFLSSGSLPSDRRA